MGSCWHGGGGRVRTKSLGTPSQQAEPGRLGSKRPCPQAIASALGDIPHPKCPWLPPQSTQPAGCVVYSHHAHLINASWTICDPYFLRGFSEKVKKKGASTHRGAAALVGLTRAAGATVCWGSAKGAAPSGSSKSGLSAVGFFPRLDPAGERTDCSIFRGISTHSGGCVGAHHEPACRQQWPWAVCLASFPVRRQMIPPYCQSRPLLGPLTLKEKSRGNVVCKCSGCHRQ